MNSAGHLRSKRPCSDRKGSAEFTYCSAVLNRGIVSDDDVPLGGGVSRHRAGQLVQFMPQ